MKLIVCPTDFSASANNAVLYAAAFSEKFSAHLVLLHIYEAPIVFTEAPLAGVQFATEQVKTVAEKKLKTLANKVTKEFPSISLETINIYGPADEQIVSVAHMHTADMIIMGTTGTTKLERLLMGSTTSRVIRHSDCPVLCIPKNRKFTDVKKIIFATDLKEDNLASAMMLTAFAEKFSAEIIFVFVDDRNILHESEEIEAMTRKIRKQVKYPKISGYIAKHTSISKGLEYFLKKKPGDMLVMLTHPRHFPDNMYNSSVTRLMSHQTQIPLLALKHDDRPLMAKV